MRCGRIEGKSSVKFEGSKKRSRAVGLVRGDLRGFGGLDTIYPVEEVEGVMVFDGEGRPVSS